MVAPTEWSESDIEYLKENYWDKSYAEISDELGISESVLLRKAKNDMGLPKKTDYNRLEYKYGVPTEWLLNTLHNTLLMSVNEMSGELGVARQTIERWMDDRYDIPRRGQSEAERVKWSQMSEEQRKQQVAAAHEKTREMVANGGHPLQQWWADNPEVALASARKAAALGAPARKQNGMLGRTGQDSPLWRGGQSLYFAIQRQLDTPSWKTVRNRYRGDECHSCGSTGELDLHHIIPILSGGTNGEYNLMTLCPECHGKAEAHTRRTFGSPVYTE